MDPLTGPVRHIDSVVKSGSCLKPNTGGLNLSGHHLQKQGESRNPDWERQGDSCPCEDLCCLSSPCIALRPRDSESGNINGRRAAVSSLSQQQDGRFSAFCQIWLRASRLPPCCTTG